MTLTALAANRGAEPVTLSIAGTARIGGKPISHFAVPAEDMMQAFAYHHLVPVRELQVTVIGRTRGGGGRAMARWQVSPIHLPLGGTARVHVDAPALALSDRIHLELSDPPDGITIQSIARAGPGTDIIVACEAAKLKRGAQGNLIVNAFAERLPANAKNRNNKSRALIGTLPAIPFEITAQ